MRPPFRRKTVLGSNTVLERDVATPDDILVASMEEKLAIKCKMMKSQLIEIY
jgi:hypothetical protein